MSQQIKQQTMKERAEELWKNAKAAEWILIRAEEYQEKFELSNAAMSATASMGWWDRLFGYKKLLKQYLLQLSALDAKYRQAEQAKYDELDKQMKDELKDYNNPIGKKP